MHNIQERLHTLTSTADPDALQVAYPSKQRWGITRAQAIGLVTIALGILCVLGIYQNNKGTPWEQTGTEVLVSTTPEADPEAIVVAVVGEVQSPGLYTFGPTARVADALHAATVAPDGDTQDLNLAEKLIDGVQIAVPHRDAIRVLEEATPAGVEDNKVSLNYASLTELMTLPGVGEKTAQAIVEYREANGRFQSLAELQQVKGIGAAKFATLEPLIRL
ncbi:MAG: ComEA family DNA-binding protein [Corynebacterium sp.]|nr:ComEA family DNA-binding protein [Corynebacterium sp.]